MGNSSWNSSAWSSYSDSAKTKSQDEIFTQSNIHKDLDPRNIMIRESRDSEAHPNSTPIIVGADVTGSMGMLAETIAKAGLGTMIEAILDRKPISDPHLMCMAIGDASCDRAPLQVTQFETDIVLTEQLEKFWIEQGGGGNNSESYTLAWYFAANHTATDAYQKRGKKGYLFTLGDEEPNQKLRADEIDRVFGLKLEAGLDSHQLYDMVTPYYNVYHLIVEEGHHCRDPHTKKLVLNKWQNLLGERAILLSDHTKLAEVIVSLIQINEGHDADTVQKSWGGDTSVVVANATRDLRTKSPKSTGGVVRL